MTEQTQTASELPPEQLQLVLDLGSRCRRLIQVLSELTQLHIRIDQPEGQPNPETDTALRLRKAFHHIRAVTSWPVDTLILHAMGPDIRTAQAHLHPIISEHLDDSANAPNTAFAHRNRELLEALSHPTPQVLIRPKHLGGLAPGNHVMSLATIFLELAELSCNYNLALGTLAQDSDEGEAATLLGLIQRVQVELDSTPIEQAIKMLGDNKSGHA